MDTLEPPFYVVSDTHWYHDNIVRYSGRHEQIAAMIGPDKSKRIDHNEYMVEKWNSVVGPDDRVLHLGDVFFWRGEGKAKFERQILPRLNGDKYLILGNHDKEPASEFEQMGFKVLDPFTQIINDRKVSFSHYPWNWDEDHPGEIRVHGHIHNSGYPITDNWREGTIPTRPRQINVSVEMICYTPVPILDLIR
jgi:calcineurin-like phosphoesterase family protein